jgi:hypothetical protein
MAEAGGLFTVVDPLSRSGSRAVGAAERETCQELLDCHNPSLSVLDKSMSAIAVRLQNCLVTRWQDRRVERKLENKLWSVFRCVFARQG